MLLEEKYPEFKELYHNLKPVVMQADFARYMVVHAYGGMYLDTDIECIWPVDPFLSGYDLVLQGSGTAAKGWHMDLGCGNFAAVPGQHIFYSAMEIIHKRSLDTGHRSYHDPLYRTGPRVLAEALRLELNISDSNEFTNRRLGTHRLGDDIAHVYSVGEWYLPCFFDDRCLHHFRTSRAEGKVSYDLAGVHHLSGSWN